MAPAEYPPIPEPEQSQLAHADTEALEDELEQRASFQFKQKLRPVRLVLLGSYFIAGTVLAFLREPDMVWAWGLVVGVPLTSFLGIDVAEQSLREKRVVQLMDVKTKNRGPQ